MRVDINVVADAENSAMLRQGLSEEIELDVQSGGPDIYDGGDQEEVRE